MSLIRLDGVILRKFDEADVPALYTFRNDPEVASGLVGTSHGYSMKDLASWVEAHRNRSDEVLWAIANEAYNACIGHVGLYRIDHRVRKAEFAILLGRGDQGKGMGRKLSKWVVDYGFKQLNLNRVSLTVLPSNNRALSLYESLGFQREGVLRADQYRDGEYLDVVLMSLLRDEWSAMRQQSAGQ